MAVNNSLAKQEEEKKKTPFSLVINSDGYKKMINYTLKDPKKAAKFVAAITSAVATNPALAECDAKSIVSGGLLGETLNLSPSPQLGQYYLVPFKDKKAGVTKAQFVLGYKGYIQLAVRSGFYERLNVLPIKQGELVYFDPLNEEIEVDLIQDEREREQTPTMGYYAMFKYSNGFIKAIYWSKEKMEIHADKYSPAFSLNGGPIMVGGKQKNKVSYHDFVEGKYDKKDSWMYSSFWYQDFDGMACKTMLRQLISKWGIMSIDLQTAIETDNGVISMDKHGKVEQTDFLDSAPVEEEKVVVDASTGEVTKEPTPVQSEPQATAPIEEVPDFSDLL